MATLPASIDPFSFCIGVLSQKAQYNDFEINVQAPKEQSVLLDYLKDLFGGSIKANNSSTKRWSIVDDELDKLVRLLDHNMPQCEGRKAFKSWHKKHYNS